VKKPIAVLGIGELGSVFARAFLKNNHPVYPITRETNASALANQIDPEFILICTGEADLQDALETIPSQWKDRVVMMQNELLPRDWESHNFTDPTVISVWFEKKKGIDSKVLISSPAYGPKAQILSDSLALIDIPAHALTNEDALLFELVLKNLYILTTNIAGMAIEPGANVDDLRNNHLPLMREVLKDVLKLQTQLTGKEFNEGQLEQGMIKAFEGDLEHGCMGRSAPARLDRALQLAKELDLVMPTLEKIRKNS
jgi:ketopantoate reductase